jgi:hypothetical protein
VRRVSDLQIPAFPRMQGVLCLHLQPEQVAEELATGVSSTPEWKALAAHRAEIEKT